MTLKKKSMADTMQFSGRISL